MSEFNAGDFLRLKNNPHGIVIKVTNFKKRLAVIVQVKNDAPMGFRELLNHESQWAQFTPKRWEKVNALEVAILGLK
jgi:hypothetical protein